MSEQENVQIVQNPVVEEKVKQDPEGEDLEEKVELIGSLSLEEKVDMTALRKIRDNFSEVFKRSKTFKVLDTITYEFKEADEKTAFTIINELYRQKLKTNTVQYHFLRRLKSGRRFAKNCLQGIARPIRHTIAKTIYHDVDMKNAHPTFCDQLCKVMKFEHLILTKYINNRDECITGWIGTEVEDWKIEDTPDPKKKKFTKQKRTLKNKDEAKTLFLKMLNGGQCKTNNKELNTFKQTHAHFMDLFFKHPDYKRFRDRADKKYKDVKEGEWENKKGTALNYYLCEIENLALTYIEKVLEEKGIKYGTLCFDGIMVYKEDVKDLFQLLKDLEKELADKMGFPITLSVKEMDEDIDISDLKIKEDIKTTDEDYAIYLLEQLKEDIKYDSFSGELWFYEAEEALWRQQKTKHLRTLITAVLLPYINGSPDPEIIEEQTNLLKSDSKQSAIVRMCEPWIEKRRDDTFIAENFNRKKGLYPILDKKVVDLRTNTVRDRVKTDYFTKSTENRIVTVTEAERAEIMKYYSDLLTTVATEDKPAVPPSEVHRDGLISIFAYGMTGENHLKKFPNFIGKRDGGKSLCVDLHRKILGEFGGSANARLFVAQKNKACHDSELFNLRGKRMVSLTETSEDEKFNEDLIKKITGGDEVNIRGAGDKKTIDEKFDTLLILATNNMCDFTDEAFKTRLVCYNFCNYFKKDASVGERLYQIKDHFFTILCEYAKKFYDNKRDINWSQESLDYTATVCDAKDTLKVWLKTTNFVKYDAENKEHDEKTFYLNKPNLYNNYCQYYTKANKKLESKTEFYEKFEKLFSLQKAKKMTKNKENFYGYTGIRDETEQEKAIDLGNDPEFVEEQKAFNKPKNDLDHGL